MHEAHKQCSLLDTAAKYISYFVPPGTYSETDEENLLRVGRRTEFWDTSIDISVEVQNIEWLLDIVSNRLYLYGVVYGLTCK